MELIFASANKGKINEIHQILGHRFCIKGLRDVGIFEDIPETGNTFYENAFQKAQYVFERCGGNVFADDSGLEVSVLNNQPGVHSAIYAGLPRDDKKNIDLLLSNLKNKQDRKARFVSVICLIYQKQTYYFEGTVNGHISYHPQGYNGFGYDPVFVPEGYEQTFAELSSDIKNKLSHRKKALVQMQEFLYQHT